MSYTNVPPNGSFTRLERVMRRQRRLAMNVVVTTLLTGGLMLAFAALL